MKIKMYIDVYPGMEPRHAMATSSPGQRSGIDNVKRLAFEVEVPDRYITLEDERVPTTAVREVEGEIEQEVET